MSSFLLNIILALIWVALTDTYDPTNFLAGFIVGYIVIVVAANGKGRYSRKLPQIVQFVGFFLVQLVLANVRVAIKVISPTLNIRPGIVEIPLDIQSDLGITLLANLITLTPGTLSLEVAPDKSALYVHTMDMDDPDNFRKQIKHSFERRIQELLK